MKTCLPSWARKTLETPAGRKAWLGELCRRQARNDPNAFVSFAFSDSRGRPLRQAGFHRDLQAFLSDNANALVELPRDHGKSTQVCARVVWELGRNPSLRVKIVCASKALAAERGRFIRQAIETSEGLHFVFPHLLPARPWTDTRLTVVRPENVMGPSLTAMGIGDMATGARADLLVCDDIVDVAAIHSLSRRERVKLLFDNNLMNLLEPDGRFWGLCTPWHRDDLNARLKNQWRYVLFRKTVGADLESIWPERWPRDALAARRDLIGEPAFARGYQLVPMAEESITISEEWVQYWTKPNEPDLVLLSVDPAASTGPRADRSALVVLGKRKKEIRCLAAIADRVAAPDLMALIGAVDARWNPHVILFETNGGFASTFEMFKSQASWASKLKQVRNTEDKGGRVHAFSVAVSGGNFLLRGAESGGVVPEQKQLFDEMTEYPLGDHDDLLDAAATGTAYLLTLKEPNAHIIG